MRLGIDVRCLTDRYYSGIAEYTANLLPEIIAQTSENDFFPLFCNSFKHQEIARLDWLKADNISFINPGLPNKLFNYPLERLLNWPKLDKLTRADVFWLPHFNFAAFSSGFPYVITVHDLSFRRHPEFFNYRKNAWHNLLPIEKLLRQARKIVAVSEHTKSDIIELLGIPEDRVKVIYSGLSARVSVSEAEKIRIMADFGLNKPYVLYLGTLEPRKNIEGLIKAFDSLKKGALIPSNFRLIIAGAWGWKADKIRKAWLDSSFKDDILFLGYVSAQEKEILYQNASVFAYPSFYEGFGFPPLEAMSRSCPVVVGNASSLPEICGAAALYCTPGDMRSLASALREAIEDKETRARLMSLGQKQAQRYLWSKTASQYINLFNSL